MLVIHFIALSSSVTLEWIRREIGIGQSKIGFIGYFIRIFIFEFYILFAGICCVAKLAENRADIKSSIGAIWQFLETIGCLLARFQQIAPVSNGGSVI